MKIVTKRILACLLLFSIVIGFASPVRAQEASNAAAEISSTSIVTDHSGFVSISRLFNNKLWEYDVTDETAHLTLEYKEGIGSLYLSFLYAYGPYSIINNDTGAVYTAGTDLFIHEFVDLTDCFGAAPSSVTISFENGPARLNDLDVFTEGEVPSSVQKWEHPKDGEIDLILFATHSDDDQLFFAGLLPYYAVERGYEVLVVYLTDHHNTAGFRVHEILAGLWAVGVKTYPILGNFEDFGDATTLETAFAKFEKLGHSRDEMTEFVVEQLRRFKPMVAVGHDFKGEYGHAQHLVYAQLVADAVERSNDAEFSPETAQQYGLWDVPKTYIHLYKENQIVMDWDQPMANFDGMTPFEVSKTLGFAAHASQQKGWGWYYEGKDSATEIEKYSPCEYGLYRSTVGEDLEKNDMFENLNSHGELKQIEEEKTQEAARLEAERLAEDARLAEEARLEQERQLQTEAPPTEQETAAAATQTSSVPLPEPAVPQKAADNTIMIWLGVEAALVLILIVLIVLRSRRQK